MPKESVSLPNIAFMQMEMEKRSPRALAPTLLPHDALQWSEGLETLLWHKDRTRELKYKATWGGAPLEDQAQPRIPNQGTATYHSKTKK